MPRRKPITAEQLMARLSKDPEYQRRAAEHDAPRLARVAYLEKAEAPLVAALNKAGADIDSVGDLVNSKGNHSKLVPVLLEQLDREYPWEIRTSIARSLAIPAARTGWRHLVRKFNEEALLDSSGNPNQVKWALHLALAAAADESVVSDLIGLAINRKRHGENRSFFVDALARMKDPRAKAALEELRDDPDLKCAFDRLLAKQKRRRK